MGQDVVHGNSQFRAQPIQEIRSCGRGVVMAAPDGTEVQRTDQAFAQSQWENGVGSDLIVVAGEEDL